jgi:hypothetical protein
MRLTVRGPKAGCWPAKPERDWNRPSIVIQSIVNEQWWMDSARENQRARREVVGGKASHDQVISASLLLGGVAPQGKVAFKAAPVEAPAAEFLRLQPVDAARPILEQDRALGATPGLQSGGAGVATCVPGREPTAFPLHDFKGSAINRWARRD